MRAVIWSLAATAAAAVLLVLGGREVSGAQLRWMGASGGAALALAGVLLGILHAGSARLQKRATRGALVPRFFHERRRSPRHAVDILVRLRVNGHVYDATLVSVSSSGALLRLRTRPGEGVAAEEGQPVSIQDYPAGTVVRVGPHGMYVDFAIAFDYGLSTPALEPAARSSV